MRHTRESITVVTWQRLHDVFGVLCPRSDLTVGLDPVDQLGASVLQRQRVSMVLVQLLKQPETQQCHLNQQELWQIGVPMVQGHVKHSICSFSVWVEFFCYQITRISQCCCSCNVYFIEYKRPYEQITHQACWLKLVSMILREKQQQKAISVHAYVAHKTGYCAATIGMRLVFTIT